MTAIVQPLVEKNGNLLAVSCPDDLGTMHADQTKVRQALFNLLSNASKFTDHGTISLTVERELGAVPGVESVSAAGVRVSPHAAARLRAAFADHLEVG